MRAGSLIAVLAGIVAAGAPAGVAVADVSPAPGELIVYDAGVPVSAAELVDIGRPEDHGGQTLAGPMSLKARTDYLSSANGSWAGVLQANRGAARYVMPYDKHETVLFGSLQITDQAGKKYSLEVGDTYFVRQGTTIGWRAKSPVVQTTFMTRPGSDSPAPPLIYRTDQRVSRDQMVFLGSAEEWGVTVFSGDPNPHARLDYTDNGALGGVFQLDRNVSLVDFPFTVEHATVTVNEARMTDEFGNSHLFGPGDTYLTTRGSDILWEQQDSYMQKAFFNDPVDP